MKRWALDEFGIDNLSLRQGAVPVPGPDEVVVQIAATSLNYRDLLMVRGHYDPRVPLPLVPCSDASGTITARGANVTLELGTRVVAAFAPTWIDGPPDANHLRGTLGGPISGTLSSHLKIRADAVVPIPAALDDVAACTLPCAAVTAWNALEVAGIGPGSTLLTLGTGGVSTFALQLAVARGARVIVTSSSAEKRQRAEDLGADATLDYTQDLRWGRTVAKQVGGGVDAVIELGGVGTLEQSIAACRAGGTVALIGVLAGDRSPVSLTRALMFGIRIQGIMVGCVRDLEAVVQEIEVAGIQPVVDRVFPFADAPAAFHYLASGAHQGKVVISG